MGLQEQQIAFKFAGGVETKMDSKAVPPARLLTLENGVFTRAISIRKRNGYEALSRSVDGSVPRITGARRLAARDNELLQFTQNRCYSKQSGADQWTDAGALIAPIGYDRAAVHTGTAQSMPDRATNQGVTVYAWEDSLGGVWWTAVDASNGRVYRAAAQANAVAERPRCVAVGDNIIVLYAVPTLHQINALVINTSTPTATVTETVLVSDLDATNPVYDAVPTDRTGSPALIAWHEHATTNIRVGYITGAGALGSPVSGHPAVARVAAVLAATSPLAVSYDNVSPSIGLAYITGTSGIVRTLSAGSIVAPIGGLTTAYTVYVGATDVTRCALAGTSNVIWAAFEEAATEPSERYCVVNSVDSNGVGTERTIRSLGLASSAFQAGYADDIFAVFVHDTTYFNTYLTLRLSDFFPAGRHLPGSACGPTRTHLASVSVASDVATLVLPYKTRLQSENNDKFGESALRAITMDFVSEDTHQTAQIGRGLYLSAACPQHYAGRLWTEQGFHVGPELISGTPGGAGALTDDSTYEYVVWYEWTDDLGEIHRGPTSVPYVQILAVAEDEVTLTIPTLRVTRKDNVRICVARSLAGDAATLYRVSSLDPTTAGGINGYIANDPTVDSVTFVDRMSDADARLEEQLYTVGGILSNDPSPLGSHVTASKNRLFFTDAQAGSVVRFSKRIATGYGLECAPEFQHDIDPLGGDITALATMDDIVYVFKAGAIFAFNGDGPFENGASTSGGLVAGFSSSQLITSDVGCTDPSSVALTPQGLMFKSAKGIYQISRAREVTYIGAPVEAYNVQNVRRATVMPDRTAVLFLTDDGLSLYFDYLFQQWSTFTNHAGYDAAVVGNSYHYLRTNDVVFRETIDQHSDDGARITLRFETAWLHLTEHLQGFQRFWKLLLLGTWQSPHQLAISHRMNYDEAWTDPYYLDATGEDSNRIATPVAATGTLLKASNSATLWVRSKLSGSAGNGTQVRIEDAGSGVAGYLATDTAALVVVRVNVTPFDFTPDTNWAQLAALLDTSAYVEAASGTAAGQLTSADFQTITLAGGADEISAGWIEGDSANAIGEDPIVGSMYGEGNYGDGVYGGQGPDVYQWRYGIHENGQSVQFRFEDYEKAGLSGASFELTEMTIVGGVKKPDMRPFSSSRST